jgi:ribosomal RNA small subunit methyltransferase A/4-diphosphocytidyl-2C-methyl-D-erythritol kinase
MNYFERARHFRTKKRLGQNFLVDGEVIRSIVDFAGIEPDDTVVEIGAGAGFVTEQLVKCAKEVIAIELDEEAVRELEKLNAPNLKIIHNDILKTDLSALCTGKVKVVANIPYYITSPIIAHLLGEIDDLNNANRSKITRIILMVQEEVARRMAAVPNLPAKQYGLLTILSQFWADVEIMKFVGRKSFYPAPKVNSALVKLEVHEKPRLELSDYTHFRKTVKAAFSQRRKNIKNCLLSGGFIKENIHSSLSALGLDETIRGEKLSIEQFGQLSELLNTGSVEKSLCNKYDTPVSKAEQNFNLSTIKIQCPAKINLTLKVLGKRGDGFHELETVMQTINLFDYLTIEVKGEAIETNTPLTPKITLCGTSDEIPYDERNLVYKAAELFLKTYQTTCSTTGRLPACQLNIHIEKNIPVSAGLAGGSTDAAGALYGLNKLFAEPFSRGQLHELCAKLGSDLNFCLEGGRALARGRGEILEPLTFEEFNVSLIKPLDLGISAGAAYAALADKRANNKENCSLFNDLEWAVFEDNPQLQKIKELYPDAVMSGSGSTYFIVGKEFAPMENYWVKNSLKTIPHGTCVLD